MAAAGLVDAPALAVDAPVAFAAPDLEAGAPVALAAPDFEETLDAAPVDFATPGFELAVVLPKNQQLKLEG